MFNYFLQPKRPKSLLLTTKIRDSMSRSSVNQQLNTSSITAPMGDNYLRELKVAILRDNRINANFSFGHEVI